MDSGGTQTNQLNIAKKDNDKVGSIAMRWYALGKYVVFGIIHKPLYHFPDNCNTPLSFLFPVLQVRRFFSP